MKLNLILKSLSLCLLTSFVNSKALNECEEIKAYLGHEVNCEVNKSGQVNSLTINIDKNSTKEQVEKLLSYDTVTNLEYKINLGFDEYEEENYTDISFAISKLKNLEHLNIIYNKYTNYCTTFCESYYLNTIKKDTLRELRKLKTLEIFGIKLTKDNIDEITSLENLEELSMKKCVYEKSINYKSFKNLKKLSKLTIYKSWFGFNYSENEENETYEFPNDLLSNTNSSLKELDLSYLEMAEIENIPNVEKLVIGINNLNDSIHLKKLDNLKDLEIEYIPYGPYGAITSPLNVEFPTSNNLEKLILNSIKLNDETMGKIGSLTNLREIKCIFCEFTISKNKQSINNLKNLQTLVMTRETFQGPSYINFDLQLSELDQLVELKIKDFTIGKNTLIEIACLPKLEMLDVNGSKLYEDSHFDFDPSNWKKSCPSNKTEIVTTTTKVEPTPTSGINNNESNNSGAANTKENCLNKIHNWLNNILQKFKIKKNN
ncbi:RNI-like protein [Piromyces finnis]|uniref:RNI-like protein n=1 Tax=Piromyces finnis TaxID=1754191 RepID=A0A1Y1VIL3_9FUNG|nr:RNI-like protein [Piromyces finnis]|eukprot:ORX56528.1 RNI-like protein [Piromyces finnis]